MVLSKFIMLTGSDATTTTVLDSEVITTIVDAVKDFIGILSTPPLGTFLTIGILGSVVGLTAAIVAMVKH